MFRQSSFASVALLSSLLLVPALSAQDEWEEQVTEQIVAAGAVLVDEGYTLTHMKTDGALNEQTSTDLWLGLEGGVEYVVVGVCDYDCSDVDLEIFDEKGGSISADYETDDYPTVGVSPGRSARFRVHVYMAACSLEPCSWGVGVFGRAATDQTPSESLR